MSVFLFWTLFIFHAFFNGYISAIKELKMEIESITVCPGNDKMRYPIRDLSFNRMNETHSVLSFKVDYLDDIGENIWTQIELERWANGGWVSVPFITQKNPCKMGLNYFPEIWVTFLKAMKVEEPDKCPIPKGSYSLQNFLIPIQTVKIPLWTGRFRLKNIWTGSKKSKDYYYCLEVGLTCEEKL
ncbi:uncharacterized protein LOC123322555 [Coccinella septempunctata]|uniref:uncharacterized protein LOC123322555 n=1 Tax=Coccinella septempunctata TaxID=41139 RepID=UPI001D0975D3|nr:uncharacterized protein LOC123322555 [Coccinella septempunctata]